MKTQDHNHGQASLITRRRANQTQIIHQYSCAPLQWLGPLAGEADEILMFLRNPNGGLLDQDLHSISIELGDETDLQIRTQGATRVHPGQTQQQIEIILHPHSTLIWLPHPLIPGRHSCFHQQINIHMDPRARLAYGEVWTAGRIGMGERWQFQQVTNELQVWVPSDPITPLFWERMDLQSPHDYLQTEGILGRWTCWGSLYLLGDWEPVEWSLSPTQWSVPLSDPRCRGQILRQVGDQALGIWSVFRDTLLQRK